MVMALEKLLTVAEIAARAAVAVRALRKAGQNEAASVLEQECNAACKRIVQTSRRRRAAASRARNQGRSASGKFG